MSQKQAESTAKTSEVKFYVAPERSGEILIPFSDIHAQENWASERQLSAFTSNSWVAKGVP
jgi:hypothetical protein